MCRAYSLIQLISLTSFCTYRVSCSCAIASLNACFWRIRLKKRNGWETSLRDVSLVTFYPACVVSSSSRWEEGSRWKHNQKRFEIIGREQHSSKHGDRTILHGIVWHYSPSSKTFRPRINDNYYDFLSLSSN